MYLYKVTAMMETDSVIRPYKSIECFVVADSNCEALSAGIKFLQARGLKPLLREECVTDKGYINYELTPKAEYVTNAVCVAEAENA